MGARFLALCVIAALTSCSPFDSSRCADGSFCPAGRTCEPAANRCVVPQQLEVCSGQDDGTPCEFLSAAGQCELGACMPAVCGDAQVTGNEVCDGELVATCTTAGFDRGTSMCSAECTLDTGSCADLDWEPLNAALEDRLVTSIWAADNGHVFVAYVQVVDWSREDVISGIIRIADGTPEIFEIGAVTLQGVWGRSATEVYAVGDFGTVQRFDGQNWSSVDIGSAKNLAEVNGNDSSIVIASLDNTIYRFDGSTWSEERSGNSPNAGQSLLVEHAGTFYFLDPTPGAATFLRREQSGTWAALTPPAFADAEEEGSTPRAALVSTGSELVATYGRQLATASGLTPSWATPENVPIAGNQAFVDAWASAEGRLFLTGEDGSLFSKDGEWIELRPPELSLGAPKARTMHGANGLPVVAFIGGVARSTGSHWSISDPVPAGFTMWATDRSFVVSGGYSLGPGNFGSGPFQDREIQDPLLICGSFGRSASDALVVGANEAFSYAGTWTVTTPPPELLPTPCPMWADADLYWIGASDKIFSFDGTTWTPIALPSPGTVIGLGGMGNELTVLIDNDVDRVFRYDGADWQELFSDTDLTDLWVGPGGAIHVVGARSYIATDGDFLETPLPSPTRGVPMRVHGTSSTDVFALTDQSELLHFDGFLWSPVRGVLGGASTLFATEKDVFIGSIDEVIALSRLQPW